MSIIWLKKKVAINHLILESKTYNINKLKKKIIIKRKYADFLNMAVGLWIENLLDIICKIGSIGNGKIK